MAQRSFKLSDELDARLEAAARADDRSVSNLIVRTLERALTLRAQAVEAAGPEPIPARDEAGMRFSEGTPLPKIAPRRQPR